MFQNPISGEGTNYFVFAWFAIGDYLTRHVFNSLTCVPFFHISIYWMTSAQLNNDASSSLQPFIDFYCRPYLCVVALVVQGCAGLRSFTPMAAIMSKCC